MDRSKLESVITNLELADHRISKHLDSINDDTVKKDLKESLDYIRDCLNDLRNFEVKKEIEEFSEFE